MLSQTQISAVDGFNFAISSHSFEETYTAVKSILENNPNIGIVAEIDHSANAQKAGSTLNNTRLILFGNPRLGTSLMRESRSVGLDLPQKIVIMEQDGEVGVAYNSTTYLMQRHDLGTLDALPKIAKALETIVTKASGSQIQQNETVTGSGAGVITLTSDFDFATTLSRLKTSIQNNENLKLLAELDHQKNAKRVGLELASTHLLIFGNPKIGTPLMQNKNSIAIDLPQKFLIWQSTGGSVHVSYNDPKYLNKRHHLKDTDEIGDKITVALGNLSKNATAK